MPQQWQTSTRSPLKKDHAQEGKKKRPPLLKRVQLDKAKSRSGKGDGIKNRWTNQKKLTKQAPSKKMPGIGTACTQENPNET